MAALALKLTDAGLAAVQGASGSDPVTISQLGLTATAFDYAPTLQVLPGEFKRVAIEAGMAAAPNITHLTAYDTSADVWAATGFGLFIDDGTLFAVYTGAEPFMSKAGVAFALLAFDIAFRADLAASIAYGNATFTYPPATQETRGVAELATTAEAQAGEDTGKIVTPAAAKGAVTEWLFRRSVRLGQVVVETPNAGSSGGLRLAANPDTGNAYLQAISFNLETELGHFRFSPDGGADWNGAEGLRNNGHKVWHAGNDGAGSGLDADLLDGNDSAAFFGAIGIEAQARGAGDAALGDEIDALSGQVGALSARSISGAGLVTGGGDLSQSRTLTVAEASPEEITAGTAGDKVITPRRLGPITMLLQQNGFLRFFGFQIAWGRFTASPNSQTPVQFAQEFPSACFSAVVSGVVNAGSGSQDNPPAVIASTITKAGFSVYSADDEADVTCYIAVGF